MNFEFDTRLLTCFSTKPLPEPLEENHLHSRAGEAFFKLFKVVADLKRMENEARELTTEDLRIMDYTKSPFEVTLEDQKTILPRFKKFVKEAVVPTRWEAFAKEKGIQKKKRSRKVFDEATQDWVPRWGANSVKKLENKRNFVADHDEDDKLNPDPFKKGHMEKHLQKEKHILREEKNSLRKLGDKTKSEYSDRLADRKKKVKKVLDIGSKSILISASKSTASKGRFDKKLTGEAPRKILKEKGKNPSFKSSNDEKSRNLEILEMINRKNNK